MCHNQDEYVGRVWAKKRASRLFRPWAFTNRPENGLHHPSQNGEKTNVLNRFSYWPTFICMYEFSTQPTSWHRHSTKCHWFNRFNWIRVSGVAVHAPLPLSTIKLETDAFHKRESRQSDVGRVSCFTLDEKSTERRIRVSLHANVSKKGNRCHSSKRATCLHGRRSRSFKKKTFCCILKRTSLFSCVVYAASLPEKMIVQSTGICPWKATMPDVDDSIEVDGFTVTNSPAEIVMDACTPIVFLFFTEQTLKSLCSLKGQTV